MARYIAPLVKQPSESPMLYDWDHEPVMRAGASPSSASAITQKRSATYPDATWVTTTDLTFGTPSVGAKTGASLNTLVQCAVSGGTDGYFYKLTSLATDANGNKSEVDGILEVRD